MPAFDRLTSPNLKYFQVAWESTLKCNLDCSYCGDGHDNSKAHPSLEDSINTVDFIVEYLNIYMQNKPAEHRYANINIQGGESIYHPNIIEILEYARSKKQSYPEWNMNISLITNAVIVSKRWQQITELVDYFTISYHSESSEKQQEQIRENILYTKSTGKGYQVAVLMHPVYWDNCIDMVNWCKDNDVRYITRQLDHTPDETRFRYTSSQTEFLTGKKVIPIVPDVSSIGRACCGGETMQVDGVETKYIIDNNFYDWYCSVDKWFLYIRQSTGEVFTNKDCKMNFNGSVGPIGYLSDTVGLLANTLENSKKIIQCKKTRCWCGLCAPKYRGESSDQ
jgi:pyruvate-formate lyase-activating enzyme